MSPAPRRILPFLITAILLTFWPICLGQFTLWDDVQVIAREPTLLPPTWHGFAIWWTHPIQFLYMPMSYSVWGVLALIAQRPGDAGPMLSPVPFHCANLLLHVLSAIVVYRLLLLLVKKAWPAAAGAALFALHPVQVEPVAWAMGLRDLLCGLFTVIALWQYVLVIAPGRARRVKWHFVAATVAYALALLSKPSAIAIPLMIAALEWIMYGFSRRACSPRLPGSGRGEQARRLNAWPLLRGLFWFGMAIPIGLIARSAQPTYRISETVPILRRPIVALDAIAFYVGKIVWPVRLYFDYGRSPWKIFDTYQAYWTWLIPAAIAAALLIGARRRPMMLAGAAIFIVGLLPVLGFVGFDFQSFSTVADRFLYVPMIGAGLMAADTLATPMIARHVRIAAAVGAIVLGAFAYQSFHQTWYWHDTKALFDHSLAINPLGPAANDTLARAALDADDAAAAEKHARASIAGNPKRSHGYVLLSAALSEAGQNRAALDAVMTAYKLEPNDPVVVLDTAKILGDNRQEPAASEMFHKAIAMDPASPAAHFNFGEYLSTLRQNTAALAELRKAADLGPTDPRFPTAIGDLLANMGRPADARLAYESALRRQPGFGPALHGLLALPRV